VRDEDRRRPELPWRDTGGGVGTTVLFLIVTFLIIIVGVVLFFGTGVLFPLPA
jgi:hypothetical protein